MSTALSVLTKMAPGPDRRQEPVAPDKSAENRVEIVAETSNETEIANAPITTVESSDLNANQAVQSASANVNTENKQEEPATLSTLNEGELRALLDEAITYKCPKDREGKSSLFKELLQEAEADETEEGRRAAASSRCLPGCNRRRHKHDSVSERLTHGGSLQNLAQPVNSEFDSSFAYLSSGSSHTYGGGRRKTKKHTGPSVSARQREGGSLPSNVNASHSLASLANLDLLFDKKGFSEERPSYDWANKEKSRSLDKPSYSGSKREDKDREKRDNKRDTTSGTNEVETEVRERRGGRGKQGTNEMLESDSLPVECKPDYMVIDLGDVEVGGGIGEHNATNAGPALAQRPHSLDPENDEGTEMKIIEPRRPIQYISHATVDIAQTPVDNTIEFPLREHNGKQDKSKIAINGTETTGALPFQPYNSVKCVVGSSSGSSSSQQAKGVLNNVYSMNWSPNSSMEAVSRLTAGPHIATMKDSSSAGEKKSLDENGNAVQSYNGERKKTRRKHTQEPNVIVYKAENVKGHRSEEDVDSLVNFIMNKDSKGKKGKTSNTVRVKTGSGTKPRTREKDTKREQLPTKLHKFNSLEEISTTKLEDLTVEESTNSSGASSISSQHGGALNVSLRRAKQRSTGDAAVDCRGDRRSWGTEEGQSIYCNDTGDDYATRRNSNKKFNPDSELDTEFLVVTKKKKSKKQQRRSSSGSRAQNLANSGSYLQRSRGFANEYRTPLSPELRRKSASSMPPSDKSDSSDLDSVHSLPVTSNSSKHNMIKNTTSSSSTPQASYAEITRMATINISPNSVLNMATIVPNVLSTTSWPSVPSKSPSEPEKLPQDYYPSLDELHSDRKLRQHNFAHSNHTHSLSLSFEKPPSPTLSKGKNSPENKKAEAREEAINKNIQVFKYVQDQSLSQHENKFASITSNSIPNSNETTPTNPMPPKLYNSIVNCNQSELDNNNVANDNAAITKDASVNARNNNPRTRRGYQQNMQNSQNQQQQQQQQQQQSHFEEQREVRKPGNQHQEGTPARKPSNVSNQLHGEEKDFKKYGNPQNSMSATHEDSCELSKRKQPSNQKTTQQQSHFDSEISIKLNKSGKSKDQQPISSSAMKQDVAKTSNPQSHNLKREQEDDEGKKSRQNSVRSTREQAQKSTETQGKKGGTSSRPPVILMDESSSDLSRGSDSPSELTFGFEVNEQLLLSDDSEETPTASPVFSPMAAPLFDKPPPNFDRPPPLDKQVRYDKYPPNFHMNPQPPAHMHHHHHHHPVHHPPVMVPPLPPYLSYPPRFHPPPYLPPPPTASPAPGIIEKYLHQPKEDFSARFVAPEEAVNVQTYNHDNIVTFVGSAWEDIMREIPVTSTSGRVQYYSGQ